MKIPFNPGDNIEGKLEVHSFTGKVLERWQPLHLIDVEDEKMRVIETGYKAENSDYWVQYSPELFRQKV